MSALPLCQVAISVDDVQHTQRWYRDVFGIREAGGTHAFIPLLGSEDVQGIPGATSICWWMKDGQRDFQIELFEFRKPTPKPLPKDWRPCDIGYTTIGFGVSDFEATLDRLRRAGTSTLTEPMGEPGSRRVCVRDPNGVLIEILEDDPRSPEMDERPDCPAVVRFVTLSVPDLDMARRTWLEVLEMPEETKVQLHGSEHEALWGLDGAHRESFVARAGNAYLEVVQYLDPVGKPWPEGYQESDLGIFNVAIGTPDPAVQKATVQRCIEAGITPNSTASNIMQKWWYACYVNDPMGFSIEVLYHGSMGKERRLDPMHLLELGFTQCQPPVTRAQAQAHAAASIETVWSVLVDHEGTYQWAPFKRSEVVKQGDDSGAGLVRKLSGGPGGLSITETMVSLVEPYRMEYAVSGLPGIWRYRAFVTLEDDGNGGTNITWEAQYRTVAIGSTLISGRMLKMLASGLSRAAELAPRADRERQSA